MKKEIIFDNVKFWLDQHIIYCSFNSKFDKRILEIEIEQLFIEVITAFSLDNYKPILIDLTNLSYSKAYSLYKFISRNTNIKAHVISKSFLVRSLNEKLLFKLYGILDDGVVPIQISTNYNRAIAYSQKQYLEFNSI